MSKQAGSGTDNRSKELWEALERYLMKHANLRVPEILEASRTLGSDPDAVWRELFRAESRGQVVIDLGGRVSLASVVT